MLKRTKGRLLLTLLVITGLAGTLSNTALTEKERKFVVHNLKDTKSEVQKSIKGLSDAQLNFKTAPLLKMKWSMQIINGLSYLHQVGVVHRDLRTVNILVSKTKKEKRLNTFHIDQREFN